MNIDYTPIPTIERLPMYRYALRNCGKQYVTSYELGAMLNIHPAQIRKDVTFIGTFGSKGRGYHVETAIDTLTAIINLPNVQAIIQTSIANRKAEIAMLEAS